MQNIEKYGHGGDIWTAAQRFQLNPTSLLDFSANINPLGPPAGLSAILHSAYDEIARYPDPICRRLRAKLARRLGVSADHILVGNGAAECIQSAVFALRPRRVGLIYPCFSEYAEAAQKADSEVIGVYTHAEQNFLPDEKQLDWLAEQVDLMFIGYPNNPTGNLISRHQLEQLAIRCEQAKVYLCIDEAFLDFLPDGEGRSLLPQLDQFRHVLLFRSLTKMYAIAGLRLGYVVGHPEIIKQLAAVQVPWSVNHLAQVAGEWLLDQDDYVQTTQQLISEQRSFLVEQLSRLPQVRVFPGEANYLLLQVEGVRSFALQEEMAKRGVLIRNCNMYPGLGEGYVRLAVRNEVENRQMLDVLRQSLSVLTGRVQGG